MVEFFQKKSKIYSEINDTNALRIEFVLSVMHKI